jgi:hypothetical protein
MRRRSARPRPVAAWRAICWLELLLIAGAGRAAGAQTVEDDCVRERVEASTSLGNWRAFRPSDVAKRFAPLRAAGVWSPIVDSLEAIYLVERATAGGNGPPSTLAGLTDDQRTALFAQLDTLRQELRAGERDTSVALRGMVTVKRFDLASPPIGAFSLKLFTGRRTATITITDALASDTRRSICWLAFAAKDLATFFGGPGREALGRALSARVERWDNFMRKGYSMMPHELFINGFIPRPDLEPPPVQFVVVHPSVGAQMVAQDFKSLSQLQRVDVLAVEPAGILVYGPQFRWYAGATWVVTFPASGSAGSGIMLHASPVGRLGYLWLPRDSSGKRHSAVLLTIDLYRHLVGVADKWKKLQQQSISGCLQDAVACVAGR